jgi:hypothetical protein
MTDQHPSTQTAAIPRDEPRPGSEITTIRYTLRRLGMAGSLARIGNHQQARELCATVIFETQPLIVARADLLRATMHALLLASGFTLLSRLITAMGGRNVQIMVQKNQTGSIAPPQCREEAGRTVYELDARWLHRLAQDDQYLLDWCDRLMAPRQAVPQATTATEHHLAFA